MKKTVAAALAAAFVIGATSTTFAADDSWRMETNPFRDVDKGHWAYRAIEDLRLAGIVNGYGDGYFLGEKTITRYEMAQIVAKALANFENYQNVTNTGARNSKSAMKADLDRLAAEFRDELDALGVRVAELEKHSDKVVWTGELRYRYWNDKTDKDGSDGRDKKRKNDQLQLRLFPTAEVNDHWKVKARMTASANMKDDTSSDFKLTYAFAEGNYDKLTLMVGKMPFYTNVDDGLVMDDFFSGGAAVYGDKFKVALMAGRWNLDNANLHLPEDASINDNASSYQGAEISYDDSRFYIGAGYHHFRSDDFQSLPGYKKNEKNANVWAVGTRYTFGGKVTLGGAYASNTKADEFKRSWYAGLQYAGADKKTPGSWGLGAHYRYVGQNTSLAPTYDTFAMRTNKKGVDIGLSWTPLYNTRVEFGYFFGKTLDTREDDKTFFGRASWFF